MCGVRCCRQAPSPLRTPPLPHGPACAFSELQHNDERTHRHEGKDRPIALGHIPHEPVATGSFGFPPNADAPEDAVNAPSTARLSSSAAKPNVPPKAQPSPSDQRAPHLPPPCTSSTLVSPENGSPCGEKPVPSSVTDRSPSVSPGEETESVHPAAHRMAVEVGHQLDVSQELRRGAGPGVQAHRVALVGGRTDRGCGARTPPAGSTGFCPRTPRPRRSRPTCPTPREGSSTGPARCLEAGR